MNKDLIKVVGVVAEVIGYAGAIGLSVYYYNKWREERRRRLIIQACYETVSVIAEMALERISEKTENENESEQKTES